MPSSKQVKRTIWLGPEEDRSQVLEALKKHHGVRLPQQVDPGNQLIAEHLTRKLEQEEVAKLPKEVKKVMGGLHSSTDEATRAFLAAISTGTEVWEWGIEPHQVGGRNCYSYGWCVVKDGQILASLRHSTS